MYKIYMHKNKINGKVYIGQTCTSLEERFGKNGIRYKGSTYFYNAIQKYGWDNFEHIILEDNINDPYTANDKEIYYIRLYNSTDNHYGYNIQNGGNEQTKLSIPVYQYSLDGKYLSCYNSMSEASRKNNISNGKISDCCNNKRKSAGGYQWSLNKYDNLGNYSCDSSSKPIYQYSLSGCYIKKYEHLIDAVKEMNLNHGGHISSCCNGNRDTAYGFMWSYEKHDKILPAKNIHNIGTEVIQYDLNGNKINIFDNATLASEQFTEKKLDAYMSINNCLNRRSKSAYGYMWVYANQEFDLKNHMQYDTLKKKVIQYDKHMNYIKLFNSISEAANEINGTTGNISRCCNGTYKTAYGYIWKYA